MVSVRVVSVVPRVPVLPGGLAVFAWTTRERCVVSGFAGVGFTKTWAVHGEGIDPAGLVEVIKESSVMVARFVALSWGIGDGWWMAVMPRVAGSDPDVWGRVVVVNDAETHAAVIACPDIDPGEVMSETLWTPGIEGVPVCPR